MSEDTPKRGRGRPKKNPDTPPKERRGFGRPRKQEPLTQAPRIFMDTKIKRWLQASDARRRGVPEDKGQAAPYLRYLAEQADWNAQPPAVDWPRLDSLSLQMSEAMWNKLNALLQPLGYQDVSTLVYEKAILPVFYSLHGKDFTPTPKSEKDGG